MALFTVNFQTLALHHPVPIQVILPTDHMVMTTQHLPEATKNKPYKTVYVLEGVNGNYEGPCKYSRLAGLAEDYNVAVVVIGGDNKWWGNSETSGDNYGKLVARDVVRFTRRAFNLSDKREDTTIMGFSMGGYGAFVIGFRDPEIFGNVIALEPAMNREPIMEAPDIPTWDLFTRTQYNTMFGIGDVHTDYENSENDYKYLAKTVMDKGLQQKIYVMNGLESHMLGASNPFVDYLKEIGFADVTYEETHGEHSFACCDAGYEMAFNWLIDKEDTFAGNFTYVMPGSKSTGDNFAKWTTWYNVEAES